MVKNIVNNGRLFNFQTMRIYFSLKTIIFVVKGTLEMQKLINYSLITFFQIILIALIQKIYI